MHLRIFPALLVAAGMVGQAVPKRPLAHRDYDAWRSISSAQISDDGRWLAYGFMPQDGDGELVVKNLATNQEFRHPAGALPPPPVISQAEMNPEAEPPRVNLTVRFTSDSQHVIATYFPTKAEVKKSANAKGGVMIVKLADNSVARVPEVKAFAVPSRGGAWAVLHKEPTSTPAASESKPSEGNDDADQRRASGRSGGSGRAQTASDLVLRNLSTNQDRTLANVTEYTLARDARLLVYAVTSRKEEENGVYAIVPGDGAEPKPVSIGQGRYAKLSWDRGQSQLAFVASKDAAGKEFGAYLWNKSGEARQVVPPAKGVVDRGTLSFSRDGRRLFVPTGKAAETTAAAGSGDRVVMDLWHWRDDLVQPMQRVRANTERSRTYRGVYHIAEDKFVALADETMAEVAPSDDGLQATGSDSRPYRRLVDYDGNYSDIYWVNTKSGERKPLARKVRSFGFGGGGGNALTGGPLQWSPDGEHAYYYQGGHWHLVRMSDLSARNLTSGLPVAFGDEQDDTPDPASAYGSSGWARDSQSVLLHDRYDLWQVFTDPTKAAVRWTNGRAEKIAYRPQRVDPVDEDDEERGLDLTKPMVLRGVHEETRETGFFRREGNGALTRLLWGARSYQVMARARKADALVISASRFDEYPDLHLTNTTFAAPRKVTDGGDQMRPFIWGKAETVRFRNTDGVALKATLFKPENFDAARKYPLMVYIYERLSQNLNNFVNPTPGTSVNISYYVSNGYLVLTPDIAYTAGYPGQSALKCVLPAIDAVVAQGSVNEDAIGIQGHSWGGYQIAYMVTQTNRFKAAEAGAPVGNMTSAYSGIRWGSGMPRQFQYEKAQSRIGQTLYQNPQRFLENSPVFYVERIRTPLLMIHNDNDDAVPWYQGIEMYLAMRRNEKEAYLMNYNGEYHGLRRRHNQKDWTVRMQQFFDHYLKGAARPEWMEKGVPYLDREAEKERFAK